MKRFVNVIISLLDLQPLRLIITILMTDHRVCWCIDTRLISYHVKLLEILHVFLLVAGLIWLFCIWIGLTGWEISRWCGNAMQQYSTVCTVSAHSAVHRRSPRYVYLTGENVIRIAPSLLFLVDQAFLTCMWPNFNTYYSNILLSGRFGCGSI